MTTPGTHRRPGLVAPRVRAAAAILVMFAVAIVACVKLAAPSSSAPPVVATLGSPSASPSAALTPFPSPSPSPSPSVAPPPPRYVFPVQSDKATYARTHDEYPAADIIAPCGAPVVAVADGTVLEVNRVDRWNKATDEGAWRGGKFLAILGDDGVRYYGAHFTQINAELEPGSRVTAGQSVGQVGTTGLSSACHLHFGISPPCGQVGDWWNRRGVIWPWPYLDAWRSGTSQSAAPEITTWRAAHGCPTAP